MSHPLNIKVDQRIIPSQAERLKFTAIDTEYLESLGYPTTGERDGRFAVFTYNLNPDVINLEGTTLNVSVCDVAVDNWNELIAETYTGQPLSADVSVQNTVNATLVDPVSAYQMGDWTVSAEVTNPVSAYQMGDWTVDANILNPLNVSATIIDDRTIPNTIWIGSSSLPISGHYDMTGSIPQVTEIDIQNKTTDSIYILLSSSSYENTINLGLEVFAGAFYSTKKQINQLTIASIASGDVRVIGHYRS